MHVVSHAHLPGHHHVIACRSAAGNADLRANEIVLSQSAVVGDLYQVIDLGSFPDDRGSIGATVDRGASADFNIVFHDDIPQLGTNLMLPLDQVVTETVDPSTAWA